MAIDSSSVVAGRYQIGERLGVGGMSEVFGATDTRLGRQVAVKFLRAELDDPHARARIESEARAAAALSHPNIVNVYDAGEHEGRPYVVMELADARSLADVIREEGPLSPGRARAVGAQVLSALAAAHAEGFVHRDVKPANILVGADGSVKLADFGIAKSFADAAAGMTAVGLVMGTPTYLSPEQAAGQPATPRSDLYAVGVVLYEALTGTPPFTGHTPMEVVTAHAGAPVPDIRAAAPAVPADLAAVVERSLAKDPAGRYRDADEMARALAGAAPSDVTRAVEVAHTRPIPLAPSQPPAERSWAPGVMGGVAVILFMLLLWLGLQGGGGDQPAGAPTSAPVAPTAVPADEAQTTTTLRQAGSIAELIGLLEEDPASFGAKGPDLLDKLREVEAAEGSERAEKASGLQNDIGNWVDNGELNPALAAQAIALLQGISAPEADEGEGEGEGRGKGEGGGKSKDDD